MCFQMLFALRIAISKWFVCRRDDDCCEGYMFNKSLKKCTGKEIESNLFHVH